MSKGQDTKKMILEEAIHLFNTTGYQNTSFKDITMRTGIKKGGIYNHFANKEQLALEAFDLATDKIRQRSQEMLQGQKHTLERIKRVVAIFQSMIDDPPLDGGCPILNASVEADDTNPLLLDRARSAMDEWREYIICNVEKGQARAEIKHDVNPQALATIVLSSIEGAIMMSKLYDDNNHLHETANHLNQYLEDLRL
jgi:TetR/AcrR family transcriptional regulator, transcriptional repressor for nem operon